MARDSCILESGMQGTDGSLMEGTWKTDVAADSSELNLKAVGLGERLVSDRSSGGILVPALTRGLGGSGSGGQETSCSTNPSWLEATAGLKTTSSALKPNLV